MRPEILEAIKRKTAEFKRRIAAGEVQVCSKERPMPADRKGQQWFHEEAKCESSGPDSPDGSKNRIYLCPVCGTRFPVMLKKVTVNAC